MPKSDTAKPYESVVPEIENVCQIKDIGHYQNADLGSEVRSFKGGVADSKVVLKNRVHPNQWDVLSHLKNTVALQ